MVVWTIKSGAIMTKPSAKVKAEWDRHSASLSTPLLSILLGRCNSPAPEPRQSMERWWTDPWHGACLCNLPQPFFLLVHQLSSDLDTWLGNSCPDPCQVWQQHSYPCAPAASQQHAEPGQSLVLGEGRGIWGGFQAHTAAGLGKSALTDSLRRSLTTYSGVWQRSTSTHPMLQVITTI